jgi:hypothetical protein
MTLTAVAVQALGVRLLAAAEGNPAFVVILPAVLASHVRNLLLSGQKVKNGDTPSCMGIRAILNLLLDDDNVTLREASILEFAQAGAIGRIRRHRKVLALWRQGRLRRRLDGRRYLYSLTPAGISRLLWYREHGYFDEDDGGDYE